MCQGKPDLQAIEGPRVSGEDPGGGLLEEFGSAGIEQGEEGSHVCVGTTGTAALVLYGDSWGCFHVNRQQQPAVTDLNRCDLVKSMTHEILLFLNTISRHSSDQATYAYKAFPSMASLPRPVLKHSPDHFLRLLRSPQGFFSGACTHDRPAVRSPITSHSTALLPSDSVEHGPPRLRCAFCSCCPCGPHGPAFATKICHGSNVSSSLKQFPLPLHQSISSFFLCAQI